MPYAAARNCTRPGCCGVVRDGVCSVCGSVRRGRDRQYEEQRGTASQRGYGARWRKVRLMQLRRQPLCEMCMKDHRVVVATEVHHIEAKRDGGPDAFENFMSLCKSCHSKITARTHGPEGGGVGKSLGA